jgi:4'-phosphopantetheinyl transferase
MSLPSPAWPSPPENLALATGETHVWSALLLLPAGRLQTLRQTLTPDEQERAGRFYFDAHRHRFIAARGILRALLGRYLALKPETIRFAYNEYGNPSLAIPEATSLRFNVSHSGNMALYAFTHTRQIGVDIEYLREVSDIRQIVQRFFSPHEQAEWLRLPVGQQTAGFFNCWTRKEAYIKARGQGLSLPLAQFDVSLTPNRPARLLADRHYQDLANWSLESLEPGPGYVGALVVEAPSSPLHCWHWPDQEPAEE